MKVVDSKNKPVPYLTAKMHARLKHDYASWHPDHVSKVLKNKSPKLLYQDKSKFDSFSIFHDALQESKKHAAMISENGNHVTVFDMGYLTGYDARARRQTSTVTLVTKANGEVITAYPGTPWAQSSG